ncbi:hypothetical protein D9M71_779830 [compost metagenome]
MPSAAIGDALDLAIRGGGFGSSQGAKVGAIRNARRDAATLCCLHAVVDTCVLVAPVLFCAPGGALAANLMGGIVNDDLRAPEVELTLLRGPDHLVAAVCPGE